MEFSKCPRCKKTSYDAEDRICYAEECGYAVRAKPSLPRGPWRAWTERDPVTGHTLHLTAPEDAPDEVFVDVEKQLGTRHISEGGFDRDFYGDDKVPVKTFKDVCAEEFEGITPSSRHDLARALGVSVARLGQLIREGKIPVRKVGTAYLCKSLLGLRIGYRVHKRHGVRVRTGARTELREEDLCPDDFIT